MLELLKSRIFRVLPVSADFRFSNPAVPVLVSAQRNRGALPETSHGRGKRSIDFSQHSRPT
jgi:hypothetical protein